MNYNWLNAIPQTVCVAILWSCTVMCQADFTWQLSGTIGEFADSSLAQTGDVIEMQFSLPDDAPNTSLNPSQVFFTPDALYDIEVTINGNAVGPGSYSSNNLRVASEPDIGIDTVRWSASNPPGVSIRARIDLPTFVIPFNPGPSDTLNANVINFASFSSMSICTGAGLDSVCSFAEPIQMYQFQSPPPTDVDVDGVPDVSDNCLQLANPAQRDTDGDGFGNLCDADLNDDCAINFLDLAILSSLFLSNDEDADLNGDGTVNFVDISLFSPFFGLSPGPSGVASCP